MSLSGETTKLREQDIKIRLLLEAKREEDNAISIAKWECNLPIKSFAAEKKRQQKAMAREQKVIGREISEIRRERLAALYAADEKKYEEELFERDLTFRKERF